MIELMMANKRTPLKVTRNCFWIADFEFYFIEVFSFSFRGTLLLQLKSVENFGKGFPSYGHFLIKSVQTSEEQQF